MDNDNNNGLQADTNETLLVAALLTLWFPSNKNTKILASGWIQSEALQWDPGAAFFFFFVQPVWGCLVADRVLKVALLLRRHLPFCTQGSIQGCCAYSQHLSFSPKKDWFNHVVIIPGLFTSVHQSGKPDKSCTLRLCINSIVSVSTPSVDHSASVSRIHLSRAAAAPTVTRAFEMTVTTASTCRLALLCCASSCRASLHFCWVNFSSLISFSKVQNLWPTNTSCLTLANFPATKMTVWANFFCRKSFFFFLFQTH